MAEGLTNLFINAFNNPKVKEVLMNYLREHSTPEIVNVAEDIFDDPRKTNKFLKGQFKEEFSNIVEKTPSYDKSALGEMEKLIKDSSTKETDMKKFFIKYPWIIGFVYIEIKTQNKMGERNIPDYILKRVDGRYDVLEIKGPNDHIFNRSLKKKRMSQYFIEGLIQIMRYVDYCDKHYDYMVSENKRDIYKPEGILLIDTNLSDEEKNDLRMFTSFLHRIRITTYDEIYNAASNALNLREGQL